MTVGNVGCPDGSWLSYDGNCYKNMDVATTWSECEALCASEGATMLCIPDATTNHWISNNLMIHNCDVWIGATDETDEGNWEWPAGCASTYYDWASYGEPDGGTSSNCARMRYSYRPAWGDRHCLTNYDCACQVPVQTPGPTLSPAPLPSCALQTTCDEGNWLTYDGNCYKNMDVATTWSECEALCASEGATMLCIPDATTNHWISNNLMIHYCDVWIGATDETDEGNWEWPAGCASTYYDWASYGEPNEGTSANCARMIYSYRPAWGDRHCLTNYDCACQKTLCGSQTSVNPSKSPSRIPTLEPTKAPSKEPSNLPSFDPTRQPTKAPSKEPSNWPTRDPTRQPSKEPTDSPAMTTSCSGSCPDGSWLTYDGNCYKNMDVATTWSECEALCASEGATMLCIPDATTNHWISNNLMIHYCDVWIGATDETDEGNWEWPAGCASTYYDWASYGEPNEGTSANCARMIYSYRPAWGDRHCLTNYDCACQKTLCGSESEAPTRLPTKAPSKPPTRLPTLSPVSSTDCRDGWLAYDGSCYKLLSHDESFDSCDALCATEGATMLCIPDAATNVWISNNLMTSGGDLWIGLSDQETEGQWEWNWESGCDSSYFDWNSGAPGGGTRENCARIQYGSRPKWNDRECHFHFDCACQYPNSGNLPSSSPVAVAAPTTPSCAEACPGGWTGYGSKCYKSVATSQTWPQCEATCAMQGAQMLCIDDAATNQWVSDNLMSTTDLWLGVTDALVEGDWEWRSGCSSTYFDWGFGGPNGGSNSNCGRIVYSVRPQWNDRPCTSYQYDCACEQSLCDESSEETTFPSQNPTRNPTKSPTQAPSHAPTKDPTKSPTQAPSHAPTKDPTKSPTQAPSYAPTKDPTKSPTQAPSHAPTKDPTKSPTQAPSHAPTKDPTKSPTQAPSHAPTKDPTKSPTHAPSHAPTKDPTKSPTQAPSHAPTKDPTKSPTQAPSYAPTKDPTESPTQAPSHAPTKDPTTSPTLLPSAISTLVPTSTPTQYPTVVCPESCCQHPSLNPTQIPTIARTIFPTVDCPENPEPFPEPTDEELVQLFNSIDLNGDGYLDEVELRDLFDDEACACCSPITDQPTWSPTAVPSLDPTWQPTKAPSKEPSNLPTTPSCAEACPVGWTRYGSKCYKSVATSQTWPQCEATCAMQGAQMLCIDDAATNQWVSDNLMSTTDLWLGVTDALVEGDWEWRSGCSSTYFDWGFGGPNGGSNSNCGRMVYSVRPQWNDRPCTSYQYDCACELDLCSGIEITSEPSLHPSRDPTRQPSKAPSKEPSNLPTTPSCAEACPVDWTGYGSKCYKSVAAGQTWPQCEAMCAMQGAQMLCIDDAATNQWVSDNLMSTTDLWLGVTDALVEGDWEWRSGCSSTYFDWGFGGPNGGSNSNCGRMVYSVRPQWNDRPCTSYQYDCACELDLCSGIEITSEPSLHPSRDPTRQPTKAPSKEPSNLPSRDPTRQPSKEPTRLPTLSPVSSTDCRDGWLAYDGSCYKLLSHDESFDSCDALCATEGATMLCIPDAATNVWISNNLMTSGGDLWIGLSDQETEGQWEWNWESGCDSSYFDWNSGAPGGGTRENCARIQYGSRPKWNDRECHFHFDCACQYPNSGNLPSSSPVAVAAPTTPSCAEACPGGWTGYGSKCYKSVATSQTWPQCEATCAMQGAQMLCIDDAATNQWVSDNLMSTTDLWLGVTDALVEGDWEWRSGCSSTYFDWGFGGPNGGSNSNCGRMVYSVRPQWNDRPCTSYQYDCACELDLCSGIEITSEPSLHPSRDPTRQPSKAPSKEPSNLPSRDPTRQPTKAPSKEPSNWPTRDPTRQPSKEPTDSPAMTTSCSGSCPDGSWLSYDGNCYKNMDVATTWSECEALCASEGATMLCIPDATTNHWISNNLMIHYCDVWIGATDETDEGNWEWPAGCASTYYDWASYGEPNEGTSANCARMIYSYRPAWGDRHCLTNYDCACQKTLCGSQTSVNPSKSPSRIPTLEPTKAPSKEPSNLPSRDPTRQPTKAPSKEPSNWPTRDPTRQPSKEPTDSPAMTTSCSGSCPDGSWLSYDGNCYKNMDVATTWSECEALCASEGATMLCIPDATTNHWISNNLMIHYCDVWIGATDETDEGNWEWPAGCASTYYDWASYGEPNEGTSANCARMIYSYRPAWGDRHCLTNYDCACQKTLCGSESEAPTRLPTKAPSKPPTRLPTLSPVSSTECRDGWLAYDGSCYKLLSHDESFDSCDALCATEGATMLCIPDAATNVWISNNLMTSGGDLWIGLSDQETEGQWEWNWESGCDSSYFDWLVGKPDGGTNENCVRIPFADRPKWNDRQCSFHFDCACQYPLI